MSLTTTLDTADDTDLLSLSHRHLPGRIPHSNPHAKHPRRPFSWSQSKVYARHGRAEPVGCSPFSSCCTCRPDRPPLPHHHTLFNANVARHRRPRHVDVWWDNIAHSSRLSSTRRRWAADKTEGRALARSPDVQLPGERRRPPSLERQDAFRDARTAKQGAKGLKRSFAQHADVVDDAELYRLGLLYDDEHERGEAFSLDAITHEEPMWSIRYRPAKRSRGRQPAQKQVGRSLERVTLDLALSFAALGDDEALAAFLMGPGLDEDDYGEEIEVEAVETRRNPPVTVVYELEQQQGAEEDDAVESLADGSLGEFDCHVSDGLACSECLSYASDGEWAVLNDKSTDTAEEKDNNRTTTANNDLDVNAWVMLASDGL